MTAVRPESPDRLPQTVRLDFYEPPDELVADGGRMDFRLIYRGPLPAQGSGGSRTKEKHTIRKELHKQLREMWRQHPHLRWQSEQRFRIETPEGYGRQIYLVGKNDEDQGKTWLEHLADEYQRCGTRFVPLVRGKQDGVGFTCSLDILFLRRDNPGNLIVTGGDIDNRIKVLLDALKIPKIIADLGGHAIAKDEDPFFCLLEDDSLITGLSVTTDRLLLPKDEGERIHDVHLLVHVTVVNPLALFAGSKFV